MPGEKGTGGGGGGGANNGTTSAAAGGSGVVYIRISAAMVGELVKPEANPPAITYDRNAHTSAVTTAFYEVTGDNIGTDAGTYNSHVKPYPGVVWPDGTADEIDIAMVINPVEVTFSNLKQDEWSYGELKIPEPTCDYTPTWMEPVYEYATSRDSDDWSVAAPSEAGAYWVRISPPDDHNYSYDKTSDNRFAQFNLKKCQVTFSDLRQRDWMLGTPVEETPKATCTVTPPWVKPVYEYADSKTSDSWSEDKPTELGSYWVRVSAPDADNYEYTSIFSEFKIIKGLGNIFTDYVEITIDGYTGTNPSELVNFPYKLAISETSPVGFIYQRAGKNGEELAFTDADGNSSYPYQIGEEGWNTNGTSYIYVKLPLINSQPQVIRMYWHVRYGARAPGHSPETVWSDWTEEKYAEITNPPSQSFDSPVYKDGYLVNYWVQQPQMSSTFWDALDPEDKFGKITQDAKARFDNAKLIKVITNLVVGASYEELPTREAGSYRVSYRLDDPDGIYESMETHIDFAIIGHNPWDDLKGDARNLTLSGRVMLANDDAAPGHEVSDQGYWQTREVNIGGGVILTNDIFWTHWETRGIPPFPEDLANLKMERNHRLNYIGEDGSTNVIWRMDGVMIGSLYTADGIIFSYMNVLPWSSTSRAISSWAKRNDPADCSETSALVMSNEKNAVIYSPCYTNGIGTIYFDAVNVRNSNGGDKYRIAVEVATETSEGLPPTDANAADPDATGTDAELGMIKEAQWKPYMMLPLNRDRGATAFTQLSPTNDLPLDIKASRTTNSFYRICVNVNYRGPVRFRIRRISEDPYYMRDVESLIQIDNIVVSYPQMGVELTPYGEYDGEKKRNEIIGFGGAMIPPFPSVNDESVIGRGQAVTYVNGSTNANPEAFVGLTKLHYRWRYLNQQSNEWATVDLSPGNKFVASEPLVLPNREGDIEWWYESFVNMPYYEYFDYSGMGCGLKGSEGKPLYTEEITSITNRSDNWFYRMRQGKSDLESFRFFVKTADEDGKETIDSYEMVLVKDGVWRGQFRTPKPLEDGVQVRFEAINRQQPGDQSYDHNRTCYRLHGNVSAADMPAAQSLEVAGPDDWSVVAVDGTTGYMMFQIEERTRGISVVHADYQNFNKWSDANREPDHSFVGTSTDTNSLSMSGSSAVTKEFPMTMDWWHASSATNVFWSESFKVELKDMQAGGAYEVFSPFSSSRRSPNGFTVGPGQWVTGYYREITEAAGMALQMEGKGKGYIQFVNSSDAPRGLESVTFNARLAQFIEFDDFSYYVGGSMAKMTNYTFVTRAAYDTNQRKTFSGNGSLSVVAFYRPGLGCYEFRVEQYNVNTSGSGPGNTHRLSLHRWRYDETSGEVLDTELGFRTIENGSILNTYGETGTYGLLFISASNKGNKTEIVAGVSTAMAAANNTQNAACATVSFIDSDETVRMKNGTYGVLSANCPGKFLYMVEGKSAQTVVNASAGLQYATKAMTYPTTADRTMCRVALTSDEWAICQKRMKLVNTTDTTYCGLDAVAPTQPLVVSIAKPGTTDWQTLMVTNINNFGALSSPIRIDLWSKEECSLQIAPGGNEKTARNDIVIDDLEIRQWRGESYNDKEGLRYFPEVGDGSPSNFVFTQSWIMTNALGEVSCELNAKRSLDDKATSIRSPLMDGASGYGRGLGLGMFTFTYANAHTNVNLLLQIATNRVDTSTLTEISASTSSSYWTTVTNYSFKGMESAQLARGSRSYYFGMHGVKGVMRLVMDPAVVRAVENERNPDNFASIEITSAFCRDEPNLDEFSWWGWNLRTTDDEMKLSLSDGPDSTGTGMSVGLNNSVTKDIILSEEDQYPEHLPFVQTPTFKSEVVGEVSFRARKYELDDPPTRVTLFGAKSGLTEDDSSWVKLQSWTVDDTTFVPYTYKTAPGDSYCAFRFAVTGVEGVRHPMPDRQAPNPAYRVLLDEVMVMEAVRAQVAFRNVAAFRNQLDNMWPITNILDRSEQPLCKESWGVQAEVYASQLAEEVDLSTAKVRLWWYEGISPWGFENWKNRSDAKKAWLAECEGTNLVFRSGYFGAPDAVMPAQQNPKTVQYMLEVVYRTVKGEPVTNWLSKAEWDKPAWYNPVDYNADYGAKDESFSAYTILDTVAPGWAWINELNIYGAYDMYWNNSDKALQFLEIAAPNDADLAEWTVRFVDAQIGANRIITNEVARFGSNGLPSRKKDLKGMDENSKCVFHVIGSPYAKNSLSAEDGRYDGTWRISQSSTAVDKNGEVVAYYPLSVQLVRPSGIIEHEITAIGTNYYYDTSNYQPERHAEFLNEHERGGHFFAIGADDEGIEDGNVWSRSLGVFSGNGETFMQWNGNRTMTPGRVNEGQYIDPNYPKPNGTAIVIYSYIDSASMDKLDQSVGGSSFTNELVTMVYRKGAEQGTNITYRAAKWYELGKVTVNGSAVGSTPLGNHLYSVEIGKNVSNDLTVVASARVNSELQQEYGLSDDNRYREAIMDWLSKGVTKRGSFAHPDREKIGLAEYRSLRDVVITNMTLTSMYWLDMDPTWDDGDLVLRAGFSKSPLLVPPTKVDVGGGITNIRIGVTMMITNTSPEAVGQKAWAPYILQSDVPGVTSWEFADVASKWSWSNVTFKVTGMLINSTDYEGLKDRTNWLPLRWFVFSGGKVGDTVYSTSFNDKFETIIDIDDPYSGASPGYNKDWWKYRGIYPVWNAWDIDDRIRPKEVEVLKPENYLSETGSVVP